MNNEEDKEDEKITRLREREGEAQRHKIKERREEKRDREGERLRTAYDKRESEIVSTHVKREIRAIASVHTTN